MPTMEVDPKDGACASASRPTRRKADIDETIERLLELLGELAAERKRRVVIIFDEFQEILALDKRFPNLLRAVFQTQPEVSHVYLGSKRHILERIFNDKNEPFWRSAKQLEIGMIPPAKFASFVRAVSATPARASPRTRSTGCSPRPAATRTARRSSRTSSGSSSPPGGGTRSPTSRRRSRASCAPSTTTSRSSGTTRRAPQRLLMLALAAEPTRRVYAAEYHSRHELPANADAADGARGARAEGAGRHDVDGEYRVIEPFFADWLRREQADSRSRRCFAAIRR